MPMSIAEFPMQLFDLRFELLVHRCALLACFVAQIGF